MRGPFRMIYRKIFQRRGFNVHSPFAYQFINDVIAERNSYYAYGDIAERIDKKSILSLKNLELVYRLALSHSAATYLYTGEVDKMEHFVIDSAIKGGKVSSTKTSSNRNFIYIGLKHGEESLQKLYEKIIPFLSTDTMLVVRGIDVSTSLYKEWRQMLRNEGRMSIEMLHFGIVFYNPKLTPARYEVGY